MAKTQKIPGKLLASATIVALLGAGGATLALDMISSFEGYVPAAYQDSVGIWTKCFGDTKDVTPGAEYTFDECLASLNTAVESHAKPLFDCMPGLVDQPQKVKAAMVSMAYNIGVGGFCSSSVAKRANAGDWEGACRRMAEIYKTAGGKESAPLARRRAEESALCLQGLAERRGVEVGVLTDPSFDDVILPDDEEGFIFIFGPGDEVEDESVT